MPDAARNHAPAAGARNLILIDARLSSRSPRYTVFRRLFEADDRAARGTGSIVAASLDVPRR